ncbi:MAG: enoyl-CoA hydratase/isomerase family protein [Gammaproteobacteria bacterium]
MNLPETEDLLLNLDGGVLRVTFNRPDSRNALSVAMLAEIVAVFDAVRDSREVRVIVMRGAGGNFCAGGDIKDMASVRQAQTQASGKAGDGADPAASYNRKFGAMLRKVNEAPQATIAICEGAVLGGGFGVACVADVAFAHADASFGLPETGLGIVPAQIAPFVVQRIGLSEARRLGVCGGRFKGEEARRIGIVHEVFRDEAALKALLDDTLKQILRCAPNANAVTKELMLKVGTTELDPLLDYAARRFSEAVRSAEGAEGTAAFIEKRLPKWTR